MTESREKCRRCLLEDMAGASDVKAAVEKAVRDLPPSDRVSADTRRRRLDACRQCGWLLDGTCRLCGCYVEIRASVRRGRCPDTPDRWAAAPER